MKGYDNGVATRKAILAACKELFYEKGYKETTNEDICKKAHVIRSSIYYHFKDKESIRYEVLWEWVTTFRRIVETYCDKEEYSFFLAIYVLWVRTISDEKLRRFILVYFSDYPIYQKDSPLTQFYNVASEYMYSHVWNLNDITPLAFSSVYGYIHGMYQMMNAHPEAYTGKELFYHCVTWGMTIWGVPNDKINALCSDAETYLDRIPLDVIQECPLY